jgi:hypothetical protein
MTRFPLLGELLVAVAAGMVLEWVRERLRRR